MSISDFNTARKLKLHEIRASERNRRLARAYALFCCEGMVKEALLKLAD